MQRILVRRFPLLFAFPMIVMLLVALPGCGEGGAESTTATASSPSAEAENNDNDSARASSAAADSVRSGERGAGSGAELSLYEAVVENDLDLVVSKLKAGADPNTFTTDSTGGGFSPLHVAARMGYADIAAALLEHGADPDIEARARHRARPLHWAARRGHLDAAKVLVEAGADVNAPGGLELDSTPLRLAGKWPQLAEYLARNGATH